HVELREAEDERVAPVDERDVESVAEGIGKNRRQLESTKPRAEYDHARLHCLLPFCVSASPSYRTTAVGTPGCGTIRMYGFGDVPFALSEVVRPVLVHFDRIDAQADDLRVALVELGLEAGHVAQCRGTHGREVLGRGEIREHVWAGDTFVDFEQGLNFCIRQIREALGDTAGTPQFIETLPRRGYRFLMPVKASGPAQPGRVTRLIVLPFRMLRP